MLSRRFAERQASAGAAGEACAAALLRSSFRPEMAAQLSPSAIPLHVVTGFLGAGKTSLINRLLGAPELADALVIVNEWGEIGLDHLLYEKLSGEAISLNSGCLCCSLRGDLVDCLRDLAARRDAGALTPFSRVVLETTGLADPAPILLALAADPLVAARFRLAGVTTLVDAANGLPTLDAHREARRQAALADRLALTKTDLIAEAERVARLAPLRARLAELNPFAPLADVAAGELDPTAFLAEPAFAQPRDLKPGPAHSASLASYAFVASEPIGAPAFARFQSVLHAMLGPRLLRVKGLVQLADDPGQPLAIQGAQHVYHPPRRLARWPDGARQTRLIVIVDGVERAAVERLWRALSPTPQIDSPDLAALADNPLAPRPGGLLG